MEMVSLPKSSRVRKREEMEMIFFISFPLLETLKLRRKHLFSWDDKEPEVHALGAFVTLTSSFIFKKQKL